ncbi:GDSL family lipase [Streptomyces sp. WAC 04229]|uniref:SGNH/GDSL hydrolase family protein n=1 Tax=Streptomyces sp. WAC 04229 TaxID=2203206 RepID=UPI000F7487CF|nr:SGNH/GDSL hydrolase family protein [Streptomyces sp. WAC 04229]RSN66706.1 GDSL family lipase [Streptomyces sp. WAC 04229]
MTLHPALLRPFGTRLLRRTAWITGCASLALAAAVPPAGAVPTAGHYAALGDSFSSGLGIPTQTDATCGRSDHNYPTLVASAVGASSATDVTCAGATTRHITGSQDGIAPQIDAVRADTAVVTLGIGGNDLDLAGTIKRCVLLAYLSPNGAPCKTSYTLGGTDEIGSRINATAPKVAAGLQAIRAKAPQARILLVGYPALVPDDGTACRSTIPLATGDFPWLRDKTRQLNSVLSQVAAAGGATFVDTYTPSVGHDACKPAGVRWIEPTDTAAAAGFHPNAAAHQNTAAGITALLGN